MFVKEKLITVPINQDGIDDYHRMVRESGNLLTFILPEDEYDKLDRHHVFDIINDKCKKMIDIYETETVTADELRTVEREISLMPGIWMDAVKKALSFNTCIFVDF